MSYDMIVPERDSSKSFGALLKDQFGFSQTSFSGYLKSFIFLLFGGAFVIMTVFPIR